MDELENHIRDVEDYVGDWSDRISNGIKDDIDELESGLEVLDDNVYRNYQCLNDIEWR